MVCLRNKVFKIRSKNAGPFTVTIDVFCHSPNDLKRTKKLLDTSTLSRLFGVDENKFEIYEIADLNVLKVSFPRTHSQGSRLDRDIHGAQFAELLNEMVIPNNFEEI